MGRMTPHRQSAIGGLPPVGQLLDQTCAVRPLAAGRAGLSRQFPNSEGDTVGTELNFATDRSKSAELRWLIRRTIRAAGMSLALGALSAPAFAQQAAAPAAASSADQPQGAAAARLQEVVVTGTLIRGAAPVGASLITIGRQKLAESGAQTLQQALANS